MEIEVFWEITKGNAFHNYNHNWEEPIEPKKETIPFDHLYNYIKEYVAGLDLQRKDESTFEKVAPPITNSLTIQDNKLIYYSKTEVKSGDVHLTTFNKSVASFWFEGKEVYLYEVFGCL